MGKCKYDSAWLSKNDVNGDKVSSWAVKSTEQGKIHCKLCGKSFSHVNGWTSVSQHAKTDSHKKLRDSVRHSGLRQLELCRPTSSGSFDVQPRGEDNTIDPDDELVEIDRQDGVSASGATFTSESKDKSTAAPHTPLVQTTLLRLYDPKNSATTAELIWTLKCIHSNYSFASCDDIEPIFRRMFPAENAVPSQFCLKSTKAAYLLTEALAPYILKKLVDDVGNSCYTLMYDETSNNAGKKELEIGIRYWSNSMGKIHTQHLKSYFIGKANANVLVSKLNESLDPLGLGRLMLMSLGSDGPNVNKAVWRKLNEELVQERKVPLVDIGTCNIHILHTAYENGLNELGENASHFIVQVHDFFDGWPSRWEQFEEVQSKVGVPNHSLLKHVTSRWLSMEPAAERVLEQIPALEEYFLRVLPRQKDKLTEKPAYLKIRESLKDPFLKAELCFVISSARIFTKVTGFFQRDEPLVHLLYSEMESLAKKILGRICKKSSIDSVGVSSKILATENLSSLEEVDVGEKTKEELKTLKDLGYKPAEIELFRFRAQKHFMAAFTHVLNKSALKNKPIVRALRCLHPAERTAGRSKSNITEIAKVLPCVVNCDDLRDEWTLLSSEPESAFSGIEGPVDVYWNSIFKMKTNAGEPKYKVIATVVKAALALSHGNAWVERKFSTSNLFLTPVKASMKEKALDAAMAVKCALRLHGGPVSFPIDDTLLKLARGAYRSYNDYLESERQQSEAEKQRKEEEEATRKVREEAQKKLDTEQKKLKEDEAKIEVLRGEVKEKRNLFEILNSDAKKRLKKATDKKNLSEVGAAQAMFDAADQVRKEADDKNKKLEALVKSVSKRQSQMIGHLTAAKKTRKD